MAEQVKTFVTKSDDLSQPQESMLWKEMPDSHSMLPDVHILAVAQAPHSLSSKRMFKKLNTYDDNQDLGDIHYRLACL